MVNFKIKHQHHLVVFVKLCSDPGIPPAGSLATPCDEMCPISEVEKRRWNKLVFFCFFFFFPIGYSTEKLHVFNSTAPYLNLLITLSLKTVLDVFFSWYLVLGGMKNASRARNQVLQTEVCACLGLFSSLLNVSLQYLLENRKLKIEIITSVFWAKRKVILQCMETEWNHSSSNTDVNHRGFFCLFVFWENGCKVMLSLYIMCTIRVGALNCLGYHQKAYMLIFTAGKLTCSLFFCQWFPFWSLASFARSVQVNNPW